MKYINKRIHYQKLWLILIWCMLFVFVVMLYIAESSSLYLGYFQNKSFENIVETDSFRNFKMNDDTLFQLRYYAERNNTGEKSIGAKNDDFIKLAGVALLMNDFDLSDFRIQDIDLKSYRRIGEMIKENKSLNEYLGYIESVLGDVRCFPVSTVQDEGYTYSYENSYGSARSFNGNYSHEGTDIMAGIDESGVYPIVSVSDGVVENMGWLPKGGYRIGIRSVHGAYFYYAHLAQGSIKVACGDKVKAGDVIGYMGDTGYGEEGTTGQFPVHLHFGIYLKTKNYDELSINPYYILKYLDAMDDK